MIYKYLYIYIYLYIFKIYSINLNSQKFHLYLEARMYVGESKSPKKSWDNVWDN